MACEDYKKIKSPVKMAETAKKIYEEFIQAEAPKEVGPDWKVGESGQWGSAQPLPRKDFHLQYSLQLKVIPIWKWATFLKHLLNAKGEQYNQADVNFISV